MKFLPVNKIKDILDDSVFLIKSFLKEVDNKEDDLQKAIFLTENAQRIHQKMHNICRIASVAPLTSALRQEESAELSRLKDIIKFYRDQIKANNLKLHEKDS